MPSLGVKKVSGSWLSYVTTADLRCFTHRWWCQDCVAEKSCNSGEYVSATWYFVTPPPSCLKVKMLRSLKLTFRLLPMQGWKAEKVFALVDAEHCTPTIVAVLNREKRWAMVQVCFTSCRLVILGGPWQSCGCCWAACRCCVAEMNLRSNHWTWFMSVRVHVRMLIYVHLSQLTWGSLLKCGEVNVVQCLYPVGASTVVVILWGIPGNVVTKLSVKVTMKSVSQVMPSVPVGLSACKTVHGLHEINTELSSLLLSAPVSSSVTWAVECWGRCMWEGA